VLRWRRRYPEEGLAGILQDRPGSGRPKEISAQQETALIEKTLHTIPMNAVHWSVRMMADEGVARPSGPGDGTEGSTRRARFRHSDRTQAVLPLGPGLPERQTHDYERHGITTVVAAGDELPDLAVGHGCNNAELSIRLASTDGTYRGAPPPEFGRRCSIVTTDRNGDAKPDLVIASYSGSSVLAARGTENGEFAPWTCCGFGEMGALADWESERGRRSGFRGGVSAIARRSLSSTVRQAAGQGRESFRSSLELVARPGRGDGRFGAPISTALGMTMTGADHDRR
jgi:hypothetical protein